MATLNLRVSKKTTAAIEHKINKTTFLSNISRVTTDQTKAKWENPNFTVGILLWHAKLRKKKIIYWHNATECASTEKCTSD